MTAPRSDPNAASRARLQVTLAALVHDVGKYVARTAYNVADPPVLPLPAPLQQMLLADLYDSRAHGESTAAALRPAERFAQRVASLAQNDLPSQVGTSLQAVQGMLAEIDGLESRVREQDPESTRHALQLARQIDATLRGLLSDGGSSAPRNRTNRRRKP